MSIGDDHRAFAQAIVAAARQHGMDSLNMTFRRSVAVHIGSGGPDIFEEVRMQWTSGRHGCASPIKLVSNACQTIDELAHDAKREG